MDKDEVIQFLEERLAKVRAEEPHAVNCIAAYEYVINDIAGDE